MKQADAKQRIINAWKALPIDERLTDAQAAAFAMKMKDEHRFWCSGDRYQRCAGHGDHPDLMKAPAA